MSEETVTPEAEETTKRAKKLTKDIQGTVVVLQVIGQEEIRCDFASLPASIQEKLGPFGLGHKLGDAAAGREGAEAVDAINKVIAGLNAGDWSVRAPAQPKVTVASIRENLALLSPAEQEAAKKLLEAIGMKL
jgi:hypothetical protein